MSRRSKIIVASQLLIALALFFVALVTPFWVWGVALFLDLLLTPDTRSEYE